jgi:hypothetical protein
MTRAGAWDGDMPTFPPPAHGDLPPAGDPAYDALLASTLPPVDAPAGLGHVAEAFAALCAVPVHSGPAAEADALAVFRSTVGMPAEPARPRRRRHPVLTSLLSAKLAAVAAAAAVTLGGAAAAAYAGKLPAPVQKIAHDTIGAPKTQDPQSTSHPTPTALPGHAAYGLCTAYSHLKTHGNAAQKAAAFRKLAAAAGGAAHVKAYCAGVAHPGSPSPRTPATQPAGKPSTLPSHAQQTHPAGKPTSRPSQAPATHPAGNKPTSTP